MKNLFTLVVFTLIVFGCTNKTSTNNNKTSTSNKTEKVIKPVDPKDLYEEALAEIEKKEFNKANEILDKILSKYPDSKESKLADQKKVEIVELRKAHDENLSIELGKKLLKTKLERNFKIKQSTYKIRSLQKTNQISFDANSYEYSYLTARRNKQFISIELAVSSEFNDPKLAPFSAFKIVKGKLLKIGTFFYKFKKWEDYGSYLGNDHDRGNDFSYTETVYFKLGLELSKLEIENSKIIIAVRRSSCFVRNENPKSGRAAVSYDNECKLPNEIDYETFSKEYYLLERYNIR